MTPEELIIKQREEIEALKKQLESTLPDSEKLNGVLNDFKTQTEKGISGMYKTVDHLNATQKALEKVILNLTPKQKKQLDEIFKPLNSK